MFQKYKREKSLQKHLSGVFYEWMWNLNSSWERQMLKLGNINLEKGSWKRLDTTEVKVEGFGWGKRKFKYD